MVHAEGHRRRHRRGLRHRLARLFPTSHSYHLPTLALKQLRGHAFKACEYSGWKERGRCHASKRPISSPPQTLLPGSRAPPQTLTVATETPKPAA